MENNQEAHWRDVQESDFLANWDFVNDTEVLTITECKVEMVQLQKKQKKVIAHFKETHLSCGTKVKPMVLNNTNMQKLTELTGLRHNKYWKNIRVTITIVDNTGRIGYKKGLRIVAAEVLDSFDINAILSEKDYAKAKQLASDNAVRMTAEEIEKVKSYLETLKPKA